MDLYSVDHNKNTYISIFYYYVTNAKALSPVAFLQAPNKYSQRLNHIFFEEN